MEKSRVLLKMIQISKLKFVCFIFFFKKFQQKTFFNIFSVTTRPSLPLCYTCSNAISEGPRRRCGWNAVLCGVDDVIAWWCLQGVFKLRSLGEQQLKSPGKVQQNVNVGHVQLWCNQDDKRGWQLCCKRISTELNGKLEEKKKPSFFCVGGVSDSSSRDQVQVIMTGFCELINFGLQQVIRLFPFFIAFWLMCRRCDLYEDDVGDRRWIRYSFW